MADNIPVPQFNPNPPQATPPTPPWALVDQYLNRKQQAVQALPNAINEMADWKLKQQQLKAGAFEAGGPYLMNLLYGQGGQQGQQPGGGIPSGPNQNMTPQNQPQGTNPPPQPQGGQLPMAGMAQPQGPQDSQPSSVIMDHAQATGFDPTGHAAQFSQPQPQNNGIGGQDAQAQYLAGLGLRPDQAGQLGMMGKFGTGALQGLKTVGDLALQPGQQQLQQQGIQKGQFEQSQQPVTAAKNQQDLINEQEKIPFETATKSGELQGKYGAEDVKTQQGIKALQDLQDAWNSVPQKLKGPASGSLTAKAGSMFSGASPEVTTYNKVLKNTATTLATALLPENVRANPLMVEELRQTLPTLQSSPKEMQNLMKNFYGQLQNNAKLNYQSAQSSAQSFGGNIQKTQMPQLNMGTNSYSKTATNPQTGHQIGSNDGKTWFDVQTGQPIQ